MVDVACCWVELLSLLAGLLASLLAAAAFLAAAGLLATLCSAFTTFFSCHRLLLLLFS